MTEQRTVIVTGAGTGIGRAIARRLMADGFRCVLAGPDRAQLEETASHPGVEPGQADAVVCDVRDQDDRRRLVEVAADPAAGRLYGLVNNAGITKLAPLLDEDVEQWRATMETNLEACFFLSQLAIEELRGAGEGRIVNIGSIHGFLGRHDLGLSALEETPGDRGPIRESAYAASKGAVVQLTRELASAVGRWNITVNCVSPGFTNHPRAELERRLAASKREGLLAKAPLEVEGAKEEMEREMAARAPLGRMGQVDDIAGPVSFLLSPDASFVTGLNLVADGGWSIW